MIQKWIALYAVLGITICNGIALDGAVCDMDIRNDCGYVGITQQQCEQKGTTIVG
jgi:hypothetical protein